jgi:tetratricopeptide (TPR) repeat protein
LSDGRYKVIDVPRREVYDLDRDPMESQNLAAAAPPAAAALHRALVALPSPEATSSQPATGEEAKALRSLGYVGAGGEYALGEQGIDPKSFAPIYRKLDLAHELCSKRRWSEAVLVYEQLLTAFPRSSVLACELGLAEMALGRTADAERHLLVALDRNPQNSHALLGRANLAIGRRDYRAAEGHLLHVLQLDPDDVEANFDLGALYLQSLNQTAKGVPFLKRFLELQPDDPEAPRVREILAGIEARPL